LWNLFDIYAARIGSVKLKPAIFNNVTKQKRRGSSLRQSEQRCALFDRGPVAMHATLE
jgi:heme exporter protein D